MRKLKSVAAIVMLCSLVVLPQAPVDAAAAVPPAQYGPDLTTTGTAISGGDNASYPASNAFDDNVSTGWRSSQATNELAVSYIGQSWPVPYAITVVQIMQSATASRDLSVADLQYQVGASWVTVATLSLTKDSVLRTYQIPNEGQHTTWRLLAGDNASGSGGWEVTEIAMYASGESPTETYVPSPTYVPSATYQPSPTYNPSATYQPSPTYEPSATYMPSPTYEPSPTAPGFEWPIQPTWIPQPTWLPQPGITLPAEPTEGPSPTPSLTPSATFDLQEVITSTQGTPLGVTHSATYGEIIIAGLLIANTLVMVLFMGLWFWRPRNA